MLKKKQLAVIINGIICEMSKELGVAHNDDIESTIQGIEGVIAGNTPEKSHEQWMANRIAAGWIYGEVKDLDAKTHPCLVHYSELATVDKMKDCVIVGAVKSCFLLFKKGVK